MITPKDNERRVDIECLALKEGLETSAVKFFRVLSGAQLDNSLTKDTETEPFSCFLRNGQRWRLIFDARFMSSKKRGAAGIGALQRTSEEDLNVEGPLLVMVLHISASMYTFIDRTALLHMSASTVHVHRLNFLSTSVTLHVSRVSALPTLWFMLSFCPSVAGQLPENGSWVTPHHDLSCYKRICPLW